MVQDVALLFVVGFGAIWDSMSGKIPNALTYPAILLGCALSMSGLPGGPDARSSFGGLALAGLVAGIGFFAGWVGGGDVKLLAAVGALKGVDFVTDAMVISCTIAGVWAIAILTYRGVMVEAARSAWSSLRSVVVPGMEPEEVRTIGGTLPFGAAICFGVLLTLASRSLR